VLKWPIFRRIVVVYQDRADVADAVKETLEAEGWKVETCGDGAAALENLESGARFDVLIFGNKLPDTTGVDLIRRARALAHRQLTPIIMLSGDEVEREARRAGANAYLRKPGDVRSLSETVARLLARKSRRH